MLPNSVCKPLQTMEMEPSLIESRFAFSGLISVLYPNPPIDSSWKAQTAVGSLCFVLMYMNFGGLKTLTGRTNVPDFTHPLQGSVYWAVYFK